MSLIESLDKQPYPLQQFIASKKNNRLGHYFEHMIEYWLSIDPDYSCLARNLAIQDNNSGRTIGELDFIIKDNLSQSILHWEVAVKFYLQVSYQQQIFWVGPNTKDRLDKKLEHLTQNQLPLSRTEPAQSCLKNENIIPDSENILLKGRLFHKNETRIDDHCWITLSNFTALQNKTTRWLILDKPYWFSRLTDVSSHFLADDLLSPIDLIDKLNADTFSRPVCIALIENNDEIIRCFVTPDSWEQQAVAQIIADSEG